MFVASIVASSTRRGVSAALRRALSSSSAVASQQKFDICVVGGGSAGIAFTSSILCRNPTLKIGVIEPKTTHVYQPAYTLVGNGLFDMADTEKPNSDIIPSKATWVQKAAKTIDADNNRVILDDGSEVAYDYLVAAPGLQLNFRDVEGCEEALGKGGVTSNYVMPEYTWELVQGLKSGNAIFTQPTMPIKCAGAPQKAMYLSADYWREQGVLDNINIEFCNNGGAMFGNPAFVPALNATVSKYGIAAHFWHNLVKIDPEQKTATFDIIEDGNVVDQVTKDYDMIHITPPQGPLDWMKGQSIADADGWVDVDMYTLQNPKYPNVFGLGDGTNTPNAKTAAAARKQAPIVAENLLNHMEGKACNIGYDGYGSCPLTVSRGTVVLAEFGYGGKLLPTFPTFVNDNTSPSAFGWLLKAHMMAPIYWQLMMKGNEVFCKPTKTVDQVRID